MTKSGDEMHETRTWRLVTVANMQDWAKYY